MRCPIQTSDSKPQNLNDSSFKCALIVFTACVFIVSVFIARVFIACIFIAFRCLNALDKVQNFSTSSLDAPFQTKFQRLSGSKFGFQTVPGQRLRLADLSRWRLHWKPSNLCFLESLCLLGLPIRAASRTAS